MLWEFGCTVPYHTIPYHTIPYHTIPYHTIPYHNTITMKKNYHNYGSLLLHCNVKHEMWSQICSLNPLKGILTSQGVSTQLQRPWQTSLSWTLFMWWQNDTHSQSQLLPSVYGCNWQRVDVHEGLKSWLAFLEFARNAGRLSTNHVASFVRSD